jgi:hypothetical protein
VRSAFCIRVRWSPSTTHTLLNVTRVLIAGDEEHLFREALEPIIERASPDRGVGQPRNGGRRSGWHATSIRT